MQQYPPGKINVCLFTSYPEVYRLWWYFFNYYRSDIHCIQFLALATHKTARPKWDVIPIPENIARQFNYTDNFSTQIIDNLSQCPLTEYVVNTCFRNIKSLILMRMNLDNLRLGAFGVFSYHANVFTHRHMQLFEAVQENSLYWHL